MQAYVESPGYVRTVLQGYIVSRRGDGTYVAPLIPQLFYGSSGSQLQTWRQFIPSTGSQTILSRSAGNPKVPREELFWWKVESKEERPQAPEADSLVPQRAVTAFPPIVVAVPIVAGLILLAFLLRK